MVSVAVNRIAFGLPSCRRIRGGSLPRPIGAISLREPSGIEEDGQVVGIRRREADDTSHARQGRQRRHQSGQGVECTDRCSAKCDRFLDYVMLTDLEAVFRALKSELSLRPVYYRTAERAEAHLFITVLAYQFVQIIRRRLQAHGITELWSTLRAILAGQCRVTATFRRPDGRALHVRKATQAEPAQLAIIRALGSDPTPGGVHKMIV